MPANDHIEHGEGGYGQPHKDYCPLQNKGCDRVLKQEGKVDKLETAIHESRESNGRIEQKLEHGNKEFEVLNHYLKGNGQPGMIERLTRVETKFGLLAAISIGAVIAALGAIAAQIIKG